MPDDEYFNTIATHASDHWWYVERRSLLRAMLANRASNGGALDVGCGTGHQSAVLADLGYAPVIGVDDNSIVLNHARPMALPVQGNALDLAVRDQSVQLVLSSDVIEHLADDAEALCEYHRVLAPGGTIVLTVPAYPALFSLHDERAGHYRRYRIGPLRELVRTAGFEIERATYFFSFLVPPAFLIRVLLSSRATDDNRAGAFDRIFARLAAAERRILRRFDLPAGLSILIVARKAQTCSD